MSSPFSGGDQDTTSEDNSVNDTNIVTDSPVEDKFGDEPLNQVISDPSTFGDVIRLQCSKCKFTYEGMQVLDKCPKCGADKEFLLDL